MTDQRLYTLKVQGPARVVISSPKNPSHVHSGGTSAGHMVLSTEEARDLQTRTLPEGITLTLTAMAGQTEEQAEHRRTLLNGQDRVWPCGQCPTCPWLDPLQEEPCGLVSWAKDIVSESLLAHPDYRDARSSCPVPGRGGQPPL